MKLMRRTKIPGMIMSSYNLPYPKYLSTSAYDHWRHECKGWGCQHQFSDRAMGPMGKYGCSVISNNSERLVDFCLNNDCVIGGTIFPHKNIHNLTWRSPDGTTVNQIDHFTVNSKWRRSLQDVRTYRGAHANSDHYLVAATIKLKL